MAAYVISHSEIKITMIRKCKISVPLQLRLQTNTGSFLTVQLQQSPIIECPWLLAANCDFVGFFALTVKSDAMEKLLSQNYSTTPQAFLSRTDRTWLQVPVILQDARVLSHEPKKHKLAVCLQPIYLLADWTLLVQFFEVSSL
ncbi:unnamed protein product [Gongylonema pulchrum]|uniref:DUF667 domain-containing protein n=1 Tax=Gongylonema pulchrum TaxID=637853 RepID=A0A183DDR3_9BILA|nr:unnamed protein product [Gongylonema pulchrum]